MAVAGGIDEGDLHAVALALKLHARTLQVPGGVLAHPMEDTEEAALVLAQVQLHVQLVVTGSPDRGLAAADLERDVLHPRRRGIRGEQGRCRLAVAGTGAAPREQSRCETGDQ